LYLRDVISLGKIDISLTCPLKGLYQEKNLVTAFQALTIKEMGLGIEIPHIIDGFRDVISMTGLQGRWQILKKHPKVICDVGHNEAGIHFIIEQLKNEDYKFLHWVLGMVNDKDISGILRMLPCECVYYFCKADIPRGLDANELKEKARKFGLDGKVYDSVKSAYAAALGNASENDLVFVGGSTFIVAEVI
jgi:dihydrofolate synthase/folylpolyglutamate synthase